MSPISLQMFCFVEELVRFTTFPQASIKCINYSLLVIIFLSSIGSFLTIDGGLGSVGLMAELDEFNGLFQPK